MSTCPLCNSHAFQVVELGKYHHPDTPAYQLCKQCGLVQHRQVLSPAAMAAFYEGDYVDEYIETEYTQAKIYVPYLEHLENEGWLAAGDRVLDVGCAKGDFLRLLKDRGYDCMGVEPSHAMVEHARKKGLNVLCDSLESLSDEQKFDCIFLNHVLEHFVDPLNALLKVKDLLVTDGTILICVPTFAAAQPASPFKFIHPYVFGETSLKNLAIHAGCVIKKIQCIGSNIHAVLQIGNNLEHEGIACDSASEFEKIYSFITRREQMLDAICDKIAKWKQDTKVVIYGAGALSNFLLKETCLAAYNIVGIVDSDEKKHGKKFWKDLSILPPSYFHNLDYDLVVIASYVFAEEIVNTLRQLGVKEEQILTINEFATQNQPCSGR
ncbi:MAG: methyltransferase domain-containing protein [Deltaproteobacteria bacterium]|jgi:SAM-dependent methyltransferase|nr:methyltransferase domain-containing protein [Deltaproteobacteria bacterium]